MSTLNLNLNSIQTLSINSIKNKIYDWDRIQWSNTMETKSTLEFYRNNKSLISEIKWMKNGYKYGIMMKARADCLELEWRVRNTEVEKICKLCNIEIETLKMVILTCNILQEFRNQYIHLQLPSNRESSELLKITLLFDKDKNYNYEYFIDLLHRLWGKR